jgi:hypothetical protein
MKENPNTLISNFFGLHEVTNGNKKIPFVVIGNIFDSPLTIHEQYDLKVRTKFFSFEMVSISEYRN